MVTILKRSIIGLLTGVIGGAIFGGIVFVVFNVAIYSERNFFYPHLDQLILFAAYVGVIVGVIPGGIIGLIVGLFGLPKPYGALTGLVVALIMGAVYSVGPEGSVIKLYVALTILSMFAAAGLGALIASFLNWVLRAKTTTQEI